MKSTVRRLHQLERRRSEWRVATDASGAKDELLARLKRRGERLRADPNWKLQTPEQAEAIKQHFQAYFGAKANGTPS